MVSTCPFVAAHYDREAEGQFHLTESVYKVDLEGQHPHKTVNLSSFIITIQILSRRFCEGVDFVKLITKYIVSDQIGAAAD